MFDELLNMPWKSIINLLLIVINPFWPTVPFLYPLKMLENLWFSDIFTGYRNGTLGQNGLMETLD